MTKDEFKKELKNILIEKGFDSLIIETLMDETEIVNKSYNIMKNIFHQGRTITIAKMKSAVDVYLRQENMYFKFAGIEFNKN